jgi:hypothetical protein
MRPFLAITFAFAAAIAQSNLSAPAWLVPYPGTSVDTRTLPNMIESTYPAKAPPAAVIAHYNKLFDTAGLSFAPTFDGVGTVVRASPPECDLLIKVREQDSGSFVRVSCAVKTPAMVAVPAPAPGPKPTAVPRISTEEVLSRAEEAQRNRILEMHKYDEPVQTRPRSAPAWPAWLVDTQGGKLPVRRTSADSIFLSSSFAVAAEIPAVQDFYSGLFESHGCAVSGRGRTWIESSCPLGTRSASQLVIRAEMSSSAAGTQVHLRVSSVP